MIRRKKDVKLKPADKILEYENRKKIYHLILEKPGLHLRELDRRVDISFGALRYHLDYLKKIGSIKFIQDSGFLRYYVTNDVGKKEKTLLNVFRQETLCKILVIFMLCEDKHIFFKEDLKNLPKFDTWWDPENYQFFKHRTTLDFHLKKLVENNILKTVKIRTKTGYIVNDSEEIWEFLIKYEEALSSEHVQKYLKWTNDQVIPDQMDPFLNIVWDVFPHPYHC